MGSVNSVFLILGLGLAAAGAIVWIAMAVKASRDEVPIDKKWFWLIGPLLGIGGLMAIVSLALIYVRPAWNRMQLKDLGKKAAVAPSSTSYRRPTAAS